MNIMSVLMVIGNVFVDKKWGGGSSMGAQVLIYVTIERREMERGVI